MRYRWTLLAATALLATPLDAQELRTLSLPTDSLLGYPGVARYIDYFTGPARDRMSAWLDRAGSFRELIRSRLDEAGLPPELEYMPLIESGYSNTAVSHAGAVGMWQFIPSTARQMGLKIDRFVDERRDPFLATDAAVRHIRDLTGQFRSPLLAAAAYNAGAGRVSRGLGRLGPMADTGFSDGDFQRLSNKGLLAAETRDYIPKLLAATVIGRDPSRWGFKPRGESPLKADSVPVGRAVSISGAAKAMGLEPAELRALNPQYVRGVTPPGRTSWLRVPEGLADTLAIRLPELPTARVFAAERPRLKLGALIRVKSGDSVETIAERHGVRAEDLRRLNALPDWYELKPGQALRLPVR
ncbi:MAG: transglycosylase SLT domain-containing protein [Gemmatimonadales bacterium]